jgi:hypothetical protein
MNDSDRRRYEMLVRVKQFGIDNGADFTGIATTKFAEVGSKVDETEAKSGAQQAGFGLAAQQFEVKDTAREDLRDEMSAIARTARSMEYSFPGISEQFRFQRNLSDETMLARARAFATAAVARQADFIAYGLPATFIADLTAAADAFEATFGSAASATAEQVAATAEAAAFIREGMIAKRILDGIVRNRYAGDPGKLAAWLSASHVEKAARSTPPVTPTP